MGFFDNEDDFFGNGIGDLLNKLAGNGFVEYSSIGPDGKKKTMTKSYGGLNRIPARQVVTPKNIFVIFDFSGQKKISAEVSEDRHMGKKILSIKNNSDLIGEYPLPEKIKPKNIEYTFNNGILEVKIKK